MGGDRGRLFGILNDSGYLQGRLDLPQEPERSSLTTTPTRKLYVTGGNMNLPANEDSPSASVAHERDASTLWKSARDACLESTTIGNRLSLQGQ